MESDNMRLFNRKNYDEDIKKLQEQVDELKQKNEELSNNISRLIGISLKDAPSKSNHEPVKPKRTLKGRGKHISKHKQYPYYKLPRTYSEKEDCFYNLESKHPKKIKLTWIQLVEIIKSHQKGISSKNMLKNPLLKTLGRSQINSYIYIYRAGGFNDAITQFASRKGYVTNKLISKE